MCNPTDAIASKYRTHEHMMSKNIQSLYLFDRKRGLHSPFTFRIKFFLLHYLGDILDRNTLIPLVWTSVNNSRESLNEQTNWRHWRYWRHWNCWRWRISRQCGWREDGNKERRKKEISILIIMWASISLPHFWPHYWFIAITTSILISLLYRALEFSKSWSWSWHNDEEQRENDKKGDFRFKSVPFSVWTLEHPLDPSLWWNNDRVWSSSLEFFAMYGDSSERISRAASSC